MTHKLLLADDSITIQKVVELILAEEDFEIKSVSNGQEAMAIIHEFNPDVILADVEMPKLNGYELCEQVKQDPATSGIPVILLTGAFEPIDENLAKKVHADDIIVKPFESQELINKIHSVLSAPAEVVAEEGEEVMEAEAIGLEDSLVTEEDLWTMEEVPELVEEKGWPVEEGIEASTEELIGVSEEKEEEFEALEVAEEIKQPVAEKPVRKTALPETELPSQEELKAIFEKTVQNKIASFMSSLDIKESVLSALTPVIKDSVEKILWEVTPDLVERMVKEMVESSLESLKKEVEKVIWETVPDLAETIITREIERIRSEF